MQNGAKWRKMTQNGAERRRMTQNDVVHWDKTPRSVVDQGLYELATVNVPVTGLVLSQIDSKGLRRYGGTHAHVYAGAQDKYYRN